MRIFFPNMAVSNQTFLLTSFPPFQYYVLKMVNCNSDTPQHTLSRKCLAQNIDNLGKKVLD